MFCYRCEYRARFLEEGYAPRCECKDTGSVVGCYMYKPVMPLVISRRKGDKRGIGGILGARLRAVRVFEKMKIKCVVANEKKEEFVMYWEEDHENN